MRKADLEHADDPNEHAEAFRKVQLKTIKRHFYVAVAYLSHVLGFTLVDAAICVLALRKDASSDPEAWTAQLMLEIAFYCGFLLIIWLVAFALIPLLQLLLVAWYYSRKAGSSLLSDYISQARPTTTFLGLFWGLVSFTVVA